VMSNMRRHQRNSHNSEDLSGTSSSGPSIVDSQSDASADLDMDLDTDDDSHSSPSSSRPGSQSGGVGSCNSSGSSSGASMMTAVANGAFVHGPHGGPNRFLGALLDGSPAPFAYEAPSEPSAKWPRV